MATITIPKKEYQSLVEKALRYEYLEQIVGEKKNIFAPPPTKDVKEVIKNLRATGLYTPSFLHSLGKGLGRSNYFKR